jgi:hypothetical protein
LVFVARVFVDFDAVRIKLVQRPAVPSDGRATIEMPPPVRGAEDIPAPVALIARIRNDSATAAAFTVAVDGRAVCERSVSANSVARVDCAAREWTAGAPHRIDVSGPPRSWTLEYFEAATHHGATRAHDLMIAPVGAHYAAPAWTLAAVVWVALGLSFLVVPATLPRFLARLHAAGCGVIAVVMAILVVSPLATPYVLLISWAAFTQCAAFILAPRAWTAAQAGRRQWAVARRRPIVAIAGVAAVVLAVFGTVVVRHLTDHYNGNYSGFIQLSRATFDRNPMLRDRQDVRASLVLTDGGGYDSQFMYFAVFDPFLRVYKDHPSTYREFIDAPPYRFGRIGFALLTKLLSADRWQWYPATMTWLILGSLTLSGLLLATIARAHGATAAWGLAVILVPGFWLSLQVSLPEPIAAALVLAGYLLFTNGRLVAAAAVFALSLLIRETGAVFVLLLAGSMMMAGRRSAALRFAAIAIAPVVLWRLYVASILYSDMGSQALLYHPNDLGAPFGGIVETWGKIHRGEYFPEAAGLARSAISYPVLLAGGLAIALAVAIAQPTAVSLAAVAYAIIAISLNYGSIWVHVGNAQRGTFETFLLLALACINLREPPRAIRIAAIAFWTCAAIYIFYGGFDADYIRDAVFQGVL